MQHTVELSSGTPPAADLLPLAEARHLVPSRKGKPVAESTLSRWVSVGIGTRDGSRAKLRVVYCGSRPLTTATWLSEFFAEITRRNERTATSVKLRAGHPRKGVALNAS